MLIKILIGLVVVVAAFAGVVALQPSDFRIVRSATISAPPAVVFSQVNEFHKMGGVVSLGEEGSGCEGRMTLTESRPPELIRMRLDFVKPFAATNSAEFILKPEGDRTVVTWAMTGKNNFVARAQMKAIAEAAASRPQGDRS